MEGGGRTTIGVNDESHSPTFALKARVIFTFVTVTTPPPPLFATFTVVWVILMFALLTKFNELFCKALHNKNRN